MHYDIYNFKNVVYAIFAFEVEEKCLSVHYATSDENQF